MIDCVWSENPLSADNRAWYALNTLLNNALDKAEGLGFVHRNGFKQLPPSSSGAVVVIHGGHEVGNANELYAAVSRLSWSVTVIVGDEEGIFPTQRFIGPRRKVWVQMPIPGRHEHADRRLICGYPHDTLAFLAHYEKERIEKPLNWFFAGQVNHASRRACVSQLKMMLHGFLFESPGFWVGLPRDEYYQKMASAKVIPCPAGVATPDTLRVAEALEAGCVPVVEDRWPPGFPRFGNSLGTTGYWRYVLGEHPPFPTLTDWRDFPGIFDQVLREWPDNRDRLRYWWAEYKQRMCEWMTADVTAVRDAG